MRVHLLVVLPILALAACGDQSRQAPVSTAGPAGVGPSSKAPESPNSLPNGAQTDAPLTPAAGNLNDVRVGPSTTTPARPTRRVSPRAY